MASYRANLASILMTFAGAAALVGCGGGDRPDTSAPAASAPAPSDEVAARAAREKLESPGGMWMPRQMAQQSARLAGLGLAIDAAALADPTQAPLAAVVSLGGCTASFVSAEGLVVTNHHCVQAALQLNSTADENLVANGFLARRRADERYAGRTQRVRVSQAMTDVSKQLRAGLEAIVDPAARQVELERRGKALVAGCEKGRPEVRCEVRSFFGGLEWQLIEMLELRDVRLVYAPARAIGNYGGEVDNWRWPRHTGDFAFYRAYVGPDGKPAEHAEANVPYRPRSFLRVEPAGVAEHDLVMVTGYPGRTNRNLTAAELRHAADWTHPRAIEKARQRMAVLAEMQAAGGETAIKAGVTRQGTQNGLAKAQGIVDGVREHDLIRAADADQAALVAWAAGDPSRKRHADALVALEASLSARWMVEAADETWTDVATGSTLLAQATFLVKWAHQRGRPDLERDVGFQDRDRTIAMGTLRQFGRRFDPAIDRALWKLALVRAAADPTARGWLADLLAVPAGRAIDGAAIDRALDRFYSSTHLADLDVRMGLFGASPAELGRSKDPFVRAAVALYPKRQAIEDREDASNGELALLRPVYMEGLLAFRGGLVAPDANGSLRISYGTVRGYRPAPDRPAHAPFTTATQILDKDTGQAPFNAPARLLDAIRAGNWGPYAAPALGSVPVAFLSDLDITGGNSGSPVLDAHGRLVGLAFDGNYEGLSSDVHFRGEVARTIAVDIRYFLWVADAVDGADALLQELGVTPRL